MKAVFPDVTFQKDRWNREYLCSKQANSRVTEFYSGHSCGCCPDSPLLIYPYLTVGNQNVYSDPFRICIGEAGYYGESIDSNWKDLMLSNNISQEVIDKVSEQVDIWNREWIESEECDDEEE